MQESAPLEDYSKKVNFVQQIISGIIAVVTATVVVYAFISNLSNTVQANSQEIKDIKTDVKEVKQNVQSTEVYKGVSSTEIKTLEEKVGRIENKIDKIDEKLDKIIIRK